MWRFTSVGSCRKACLSVCVIKHDAMNISALDGCVWSSSRPGRFAYCGISGTHWIGGLIGLQNRCGHICEEMNLCFCRESNLGRLACSLVNILFVLSWFLAQCHTRAFSVMASVHKMNRTHAFQIMSVCSPKLPIGFRENMSGKFNFDSYRSF